MGKCLFKGASAHPSRGASPLPKGKHLLLITQIV
uniref:Uncharacterized protein n=1 Tax=Rhizophora mucronata TaxID=61149 RepID=A0A2P2PKG0_RHIMU